MARRAIVWRAMLLALMIAWLGILYQKTQNVDSARYNESIAKLRLLMQYDSQWNLDVLRAMNRIAANYDPLVEPLAHFNTLPKEILAAARDVGVTDSAELRAAEAEFQAAVAMKQEYVEGFKSSNSVLHNSLAFLPIAAQAVQAPAKHPKLRDRLLANEAERLLLRIFKYNVYPDIEAGEEIEKSLNRLALDNPETNERARAVRIFTAHGLTALRRMQINGEQLNRIYAVPIDTRINAMIGALSAGYRMAQNRVENYRQSLFIYVGFLLILLVYYAYRLAQSYSALNRSNNQLKNLNETLEQRVRDRTEALSRANNELTHTLSILQLRTDELADKNEKLRLAGERVQKELELARGMQLAILPQKFPNEPGWSVYARMLAAYEMAGDFYDCFPLPDGRYGVLIADVCGKGVSAAFFMAVSRTVLLDQAITGRPPSNVLEHANNLLCDRNPMEMFVTACYGIYNPRDGQFVYANAGHHPCLRRMASGSVESLPCSHELALGIQPGMGFTDHVANLDHGDTLLLFTDGVTEAFSVNGEAYGDYRLNAWLSAAAPEGDAAILVSGLVGNITAFIAGAEASDDLTCLILCRKKMDAHLYGLSRESSIVA